MNKKIIVDNYLEAALWTAELDSRSIFEVSLPSRQKAEADVDLFVEKAGKLLDGMDETQIGHDFWLTINHHGCGFWDRGLGKVGDELTKICHEFKEVNVWGDNPEIIIE